MNRVVDFLNRPSHQLAVVSLLRLGGLGEGVDPLRTASVKWSVARRMARYGAAEGMSKSPFHVVDNRKQAL